jgi:hypothetical protein
MTIKDVASQAGLKMVRTVRKWQHEGKIPPAPPDGDYSPAYVQAVRGYRETALSTQSKKYWAKLTAKERSDHAKKNWTPERKTKQSVTMKNVRAGLTGMTAEELEEWNANSKNACDTEEVRKAKADGAKELWERRRKAIAEADKLKARQVGRPRTRQNDISKYGPRIMELKKLGKSNEEVRMIMNRESGQNRSKSGWRHVYEDLIALGSTIAP